MMHGRWMKQAIGKYNDWGWHSAADGMIKAIFGFSNRYDLLDRTDPLQPREGILDILSGINHPQC